jgi:hypothetical protein
MSRAAQDREELVVTWTFIKQHALDPLLKLLTNGTEPKLDIACLHAVVVAFFGLRVCNAHCLLLLVHKWVERSLGPVVNDILSACDAAGFVELVFRFKAAVDALERVLMHADAESLASIRDVSWSNFEEQVEKKVELVAFKFCQAVLKSRVESIPVVDLVRKYFEALALISSAELHKSFSEYVGSMLTKSLPSSTEILSVMDVLEQCCDLVAFETNVSSSVILNASQSCQPLLKSKILSRLSDFMSSSFIARPYAWGEYFLDEDFNLCKFKEVSLFCSSDQSYVRNVSDIIEQSVIQCSFSSCDAKSEEPSNSRISNPEDFIQTVLFLVARLSLIVNKCFPSGNKVRLAMKQGFCHVFVSPMFYKKPFSDYMAKFIHETLQSRPADMDLDDDEMYGLMDRIAFLFECLPDIESFMVTYRENLGSRLIERTSYSEEFEHYMISRLKPKAGARLTYKLEKMLADISISTRLMKAFEAHMSKLKSSLEFLPKISPNQVVVPVNPHNRTYCMQKLCALCPEFSVTILSQGIWPVTSQVHIRIPASMRAAISIFEDFYLRSRTQPSSQGKDRKVLSWPLELGNALMSMEVIGSSKKPITFIVTPLQAILLKRFSIVENAIPESKEFSVSELSNDLELSDWITRRILHSLTFCKYPLLIKCPPGPLISNSDLFSVNLNLEVDEKVIRFPFPDLHPRSTDSSTDVSMAIKANIVRFLKRRRLASKQQIIDHVLQHLEKFHPTESSILIALDSLIEGEFVELDSSVSEMYHYVL